MTKKSYKAPTSGYEDYLYTCGSTKSPTDFLETQKQLARYLSTQTHIGASLASVAYETMTTPDMAQPPKPSKPEKKGEDETTYAIETALYSSELVVWAEDYKEFKRKLTAWENSQTRMFNLTLQHCTPELEDKLKVTSGYKDVYQERDPITLLALIRDVAHDHTEDKNEVMACVESDLALYTCAQGPKQTNLDYAKHFRAQVKTVMAHGGQPWSHPSLAKLLGADIRKEMYGSKPEGELEDEELELVRKEATAKANEKYLACLFIALADAGRYSELKQELCNAYLFKQDKYPKNIVEALGLLKNYVPGRLAAKKVSKDEGESRKEVLAFVEAGGTSAANTLVCFLCGNVGHKAKQCTVVSAEKKQEYLAKRWKGSQEDRDKTPRKKKQGVANLGVDEKEDGSEDESDEPNLPEGAPTYEEYLKEMGYSLFTCGVEPQDGVSELQGGDESSFSNSDAEGNAPRGGKTISWADRVRGVSFEEGQEWEAEDGVRLHQPGGANPPRCDSPQS